MFSFHLNLRFIANEKLPAAQIRTCKFELRIFLIHFHLFGVNVNIQWKRKGEKTEPTQKGFSYDEEKEIKYRYKFDSTTHIRYLRYHFMRQVNL